MEKNGRLPMIDGSVCCVCSRSFDQVQRISFSSINQWIDPNRWMFVHCSPWRTYDKSFKWTEEQTDDWITCVSFIETAARPIENPLSQWEGSISYPEVDGTESFTFGPVSPQKMSHEYAGSASMFSRQRYLLEKPWFRPKMVSNFCIRAKCITRKHCFAKKTDNVCAKTLLLPHCCRMAHTHTHTVLVVS